jgi:hypothetical protein
MSTDAQIRANQANSQKSTGPVTEEGKARVSANGISHGLSASQFLVLDWEDQNQFDQFAADLKADTNPQTPEEHRLVHSIIQHYWLMQRALTMQEILLNHNPALDPDDKRMALYIRYQTTNERSYYRARKELQTLRKQKLAEEIGFASQKQKAAESEANVRLTNAKAEALEIETEVHKTVEAPLPGNLRIDFADIQDACAAAVRSLVDEKRIQAEQSAAA